MTNARSLLRQHGLHPKKSLGQNFLVDPNYLEKIADCVPPLEQAGTVVEIGPGLGALTEVLAERGYMVRAVEVDRDLVPILTERFVDSDNVEIVEGDALKLDLAPIAQKAGGPVWVVGNLPYNISTPLLFHMLDQRDHLAGLLVMLQREVADRIAASPGTKEYGTLSVQCRMWAEIRTEFHLPPTVFHPPPQVTSSFLTLKVRETPLAPVPDPRLFREVVRRGFGQRRKTLANALKGIGGLKSARIAELLVRCGLEPNVRGERLTPEQFAQLATLVGREG